MVAHQFSLDRQKITPADSQSALQAYPPLSSHTPLFERLFGSGWLANLRTRLLGPQFVAFVDTLLQHQLALQTNLLRQGVMVDMLQVELIIRQAVLQHAIYYQSEYDHENR